MTENSFRNKQFRINVFAFIAVFLILASACGGKPDSGRPSADARPGGQAASLDDGTIQPLVLSAEVTHESRDLPPPKIKTSTESASVVFVCGTVEVSTADLWKPLDIGDSIERDDMIRTGEDSYCEIQCGSNAVVRIQSKTSFTLKNAEIGKEENTFAMEVIAGSVLCKVEKLTGNSRFEVRTPTTVCAVRGTEFLISVSNTEVTKLAVKKGAVSILPASLALNSLRESNDPVVAAVAEAAVLRLEQTATKITADQEILMDPATAGKSDKAARTFENSVKQIAASVKADKSETVAAAPAVVQSIEKAAAATAPVLMKNVPEAVVAAPETKQELAASDTLRIIEIPGSAAPAGTPGSDAGAGSGTGKPKPPEIVVVSVRTEPAQASIYSNGLYIAKGKFSALYEKGEILSFTASLPGYRKGSITIDTATAGNREFTLRLEPGADRLNIKAVPGNAEIFIDGQNVGTGVWTGDIEPGKTVSVSARLDGFVESTSAFTAAGGSSGEIVLKLEPIEVPVTITAIPPEAEISVNGKPAGKGSAALTLPVGTEIRIQAALKGYESRSTAHTVTEKDGNAVRLDLTQSTRTVRISAVPGDSSILVNGKVMGSGSYEQAWTYGETLSIEIKRGGYKTVKTSVRIDDSVKPAYSFTLKKDEKSVVVKTVPSDAVIMKDGKTAGTGTASFSTVSGDRIELKIVRDGYEDGSLVIEGNDETKNEYRVSLTMKPVYARIPSQGADIIGLESTSDGKGFIAADGDGTIMGFTVNGKLLWKTATANAGNENAVPVVSAGRVYFSGARELAVINAASGAVLWRRGLSSEESHIFGQRIFASDGGVLLPSSSGIISLTPSGEPKKVMFKVAGNLMSPGLFGVHPIIANQKGTVFVFDPNTGDIVKEIPTTAVQPVAQRIVTDGTAGFFAGRKGTLAAVDLEKGTVLWESTPKQNATGFYTDLTVTARDVIAYTSGSIMVLDRVTGKLRYPELTGAVTPPELADGTLWFGSDSGKLTAVNVQNGKVLKTFNAGGKISVKPCIVGDRLFAGLENGELVVIQLQALK